MKTQARALPRCLRLRGKPINAVRRRMTPKERRLANELLRTAKDNGDGSNITALICGQFGIVKKEDENEQH